MNVLSILQTSFYLQYFWLPVSISVIISLLTAFLTYRFNLRKLKKEIAETIEKVKYEHIIRAHQRCYSLLVYLTKTENTKSIFYWRRNQHTKNDTYYMNWKNSSEYLEQLRVIFYDEGNGIYVSPEVRDALFECRSIVFGIHLKADKPHDGQIKIENAKVYQRIFDLYDIINKEIRKAIELETRKINLKRYLD